MFYLIVQYTYLFYVCIIYFWPYFCVHTYSTDILNFFNSKQFDLLTHTAILFLQQQKFLKRAAEPGAGPGSGQGGQGGQGGGGASPPGKLQRVGSGGNENLTKFSVEIVQQLEFTSAADSQPQQISTNVTVKALTNSVKSEAGTPLLECKREPDHDFPDLEQCAAAVERDAASNFPGFTDLIGDEAGNEIIMSDAFKDLISEISDYPEFMKDFNFEDKCDNLGLEDRGVLLNDNRVKIEDGGQGLMRRSESPGQGNNNRGFGPRPGGGYGGGELSPAAQTLKQMAEQHQHKQGQLGLGPRTARSPYAELQDYLSGPGGAFRKQEQVKQEPSYPPSYKQYSPYGSPSSGGSPGYLPRPPLGGPSPPRPPSGPPPQASSGNLHINQAQHLHISHPSHGIQVCQSTLLFTHCLSIFCVLFQESDPLYVALKIIHRALTYLCLLSCC